MNPIQNEIRGQDYMAPKASYEKPKVTTFGSVVKLTLGSTGSISDGKSGGSHSKGGGKGH